MNILTRTILTHRYHVFFKRITNLKKLRHAYVTESTKGQHVLLRQSKILRIQRVFNYYMYQLKTLEDDLQIPKEQRYGQVQRSTAAIKKPENCGIRRFTQKTARIWDKIQRSDESLPEYLIGNKVLREIPLKLVHLDFKHHRRLMVFHNKGFKCANPKCDRVGTRLIITVDGSGGRHVDVYTDDFHLMNVDHIYPKSKGGGEELSNKQPMCYNCNSKKSNKIEKDVVYIREN